MEKITIETLVLLPVEKVWDAWTQPKHITQWNAASEDWCSPWSKNDVTVGGKFSSRMEARDGSAGFDFSGTYTKVEPHRVLAYTLDDDRTVEVVFNPQGDKTHVVETFEAETENSIELQRFGWQSILDNFKKYCESANFE